MDIRTPRQSLFFSRNDVKVGFGTLEPFMDHWEQSSLFEKRFQSVKAWSNQEKLSYDIMFQNVSQIVS